MMSKEQSKTQSGHAASSSETLERYQLYCNAIIAFAAITAIAITTWQGCAIGRQTQLMKAQLSRPWLSFETPDIEPPKVDEAIKGTVHIKNTGTAPATIVGYSVVPVVQVGAGAVVLQNDQIRLKFSNINIDFESTLAALRDSAKQFGEVRFGTQSLGPESVAIPGASLPFEIESAKPLSKEDMGVLNDNGIVVIVVYTKYLDAIEETHETWSCFVYDAATKQCRMHTKYNHMD